jgi:hypothetical protein
MHATAVDGSRTHTGIAYLAETTIAGKVYTARSRHRVPNALATAARS